MKVTVPGVAWGSRPRVVNRERERDAHNEKEAGEDRVRKGPAIPRGVRELTVALLVRELPVHEDHRGDGGATQDIDGLQSR